LTDTVVATEYFVSRIAGECDLESSGLYGAEERQGAYGNRISIGLSQVPGAVGEKSWQFRGVEFDLMVLGSAALRHLAREAAFV